jgi:hypothetical protein
MHYDGKQWRTVDGPASAVFKVAAPATDDVWGVGSLSLVHWDGKHWTDLSKGPFDVEQLWAPARGVAWATAHPHKQFGKLVLVRWEKSEWKRVADAPGASISGLAPDDVWVAGPRVMRRKNGHWLTVFATGDDGLTVTHGELHVVSESDVWVTGSGLRHWNGTAATTEAAPMVNGNVAVHGHDLFLYSRSGILHRTMP